MEILKRFEFRRGGARKIDARFDELFDGKIRRGTLKEFGYDTERRFYSNIYSAAKRRGLKVHASIKDGVATIQAYNHKEEK